MHTLHRQQLALDASSTLPYYRQLYQRIILAIAGGTLRPGERVPATRALAQDLGLARGTVATAYAMLVADGYLETHGAAGSVVAAGHLATPILAAQPQRGEAGMVLGDGAAVPPLPFQMGLPALDAFPRKLWARIAARAARSTQSLHMVRESSAGAPALRLAIAGYLQLSRGLACRPEQVFITAGYRSSMELFMRALLSAGDQVWTEEPGYPPTAQVLRGAGMAPVAVPVDAVGLMVERGIAAAPAARAAVVTPAHQSPLTVTLSPARRAALLDWAQAADAWVLEDDYDGEFHYTGRPLPALAAHGGNAGGERVIYSGTFSKTLFPSIRLAYLVVPAALVPRFQGASSVMSSGSPALTQGIVSDFIREGHFTRHILRMRKLYRERRAHTLRGLTRALGGGDGDAAYQSAGMHLLLPVPIGCDAVLATRMREHGMAPLVLSDWYHAAPQAGGLLLNFTNMSSEDAAYRLGRQIAQLRDA